MIRLLENIKSHFTGRSGTEKRTGVMYVEKTEDYKMFTREMNVCTLFNMECEESCICNDCPLLLNFFLSYKTEVENTQIH